MLRKALFAALFALLLTWGLASADPMAPPIPWTWGWSGYMGVTPPYPVVIPAVRPTPMPAPIATPVPIPTIAPTVVYREHAVQRHQDDAWIARQWSRRRNLGCGQCTDLLNGHIMTFCKLPSSAFNDARSQAPFGTYCALSWWTVQNGRWVEGTSYIRRCESLMKQIRKPRYSCNWWM